MLKNKYPTGAVSCREKIKAKRNEDAVLLATSPRGDAAMMVTKSGV